MKYLSILLIVTTFISSLYAEAKIHFDLHAQHFANAIEGSMKVGRYDLDDTQVSTNLNYVNGYYTTTNDNGYMNVDLKSPIAEWSVACNISGIFDSYSYNYEIRTIKLIAENGESIMVSIRRNQIMFEGTNVISGTQNQSYNLDISLTKNGDNVDLVINGINEGSATRTTFSSLKSVEVRIVKEDTASDDLQSLTIGSK
jgi:hypothetical protein